MFEEVKTNLDPAAPEQSALPVQEMASTADSTTAEVGGEVNGVAEANPDRMRYAVAGRKGAERVHQLIRNGRLYEQEHGLKRGRQRLRQLIEEGKLYEQEHGLRAPRKAGRRLGRLGREQVLRTFLEAACRMARPAFRDRLRQVMAALDKEDR
jgi:general stress protein YciG